MSSDIAGVRGPYKKGRERRQAIVEAAATLFAERGYTAGSMRELGNRVGLTQTGLLHYFSTKEELLTEVIRYRDDSVALALADVDPDDPIDRGIRIARHAKEQPGLTALFTILSAEATEPAHPAHPYFTERYETSLVSSLRENEMLQSRGAMRADILPRHVAAIMVAVLDGLQLQSAYIDDLDPEAVIASLWKMLEPMPNRSDQAPPPH